MLLPLVYTAPIRGVKVVAEVEVHVIPGELHKFTWKGYGFKLYVPVDALPCSGTKAPVKISVKASIMLNCLPTLNWLLDKLLRKVFEASQSQHTALL